MGDAENCRRMDSSNSSSSDEPSAVEKKMRVDESAGITSSEGNLAAAAPQKTETPTPDPAGVPEGSVGSEGQKANGNANSSTSSKDDVPKSSSEDAAVASSSSSVPLEVPPPEDQEMKAVDGQEDKSLVDAAPEKEDEGELIDLKVVFNKKPLAIKISLTKTVGDLKKLIEVETKVAPALQKVLIKGIPKDDLTLQSLGVTKSTKILVIGSSLDEVMAMAKPPDKEALAAEESNAIKQSESWCTLTQHKKVIDKGVPDDAMVGILGEPEPLPPIPLYGMLSSKGAKVRLTFKLEADELWIGTKERTEKIAIGTIRNVTSQPITGYEHYHIVAIQLGPTEASRYFVYWVPAQYVEAIKDALGS